ncbi:hypothetical protein AMTRI_Chr02g262280 [Amborella trichopoda]
MTGFYHISLKALLFSLSFTIIIHHGISITNRPYELHIHEHAPHTSLITSSFTLRRTHFGHPARRAESAIRSGLAVALKTSFHISQLKKRMENDPFYVKGLSICESLYSDAAQRLSASLNGLRKVSYGQAMKSVSMVAGEIDTCEKGFGEREGYSSPLTRRNDGLVRLCNKAIGNLKKIH